MGTTADKLNKILESKVAIKAAIEAKGVADVGDALSAYPEKIANIPSGSGSGYTGHADVEGLKAIGWTDEDIQYYQKYGVNWNEEDDEYHKVPQINIDLYGTLTVDNLQEHFLDIIYLPKIDIGDKTDISGLLSNFLLLVAIPLIDISKVTNISQMFSGCSSLTSIPLLDTSNVTNMSNVFSDCVSLIHIPKLNIENVQDLGGAFSNCLSLVSISLMFNSENITTMINTFAQCFSLRNIPLINAKNIKEPSNNIFKASISLTSVKINNLKISLSIADTSFLSKESIIYIIQNAAPTEAITITLNAYVYDKYAEDVEVKAALEAQPLISLAKA